MRAMSKKPTKLDREFESWFANLPQRGEAEGKSTLLFLTRDDLERPAGWTDDRWAEHLEQVDVWTGYDGHSAKDVSEIFVDGPGEEDDNLD